MATFVAECPRCKATNSTFDTRGASAREAITAEITLYEVLGQCRSCDKAWIFVMNCKSDDLQRALHRSGGIDASGVGLDKFVRFLGPLTAADIKAGEPPEHLPDNINDTFIEGSKCLVINCHNAAGVMFRRCVDLMIKDKHPSVTGSLKRKLDQLFDNNLIDQGLKDLADSIREDGNDAAHNDPIDQADAEDLMDFAAELLRQTYTVPAQVQIAGQRRLSRRSAANTP